MKRLFIIIALIVGCTCSKAQFNYANQWALSASGAVTSYAGYSIEVGTQTTFKLSPHSIYMNFSYTSNPVTIGQERIFTNLFLFDLFYGYSFDNIIRSKLFHLNFGIGASVGAEVIPPLSTAGVYLNETGGIRFGAGAKLQLEFKVSQTVGLYLEPKYSYIFKSPNPNLFVGAIGVKLYL